MGSFCVLNSRISNIDFNGEVIIKYTDGRYKCKCTNTSTLHGFSDWDNNHLLCKFCGRIFDKNTLVIKRGITI